MSLRADFLINDGSPMFVTEKTIWGDGVQIGTGGAELALLTICAELKKRGHDIVLYNNPRELGASSFEQRPIADFKPKDKRDVLVIFRSPHLKSLAANGYKVWWSCDQHTVGSFQDFSKTVNKIVTISPYHSDYFSKMYGIENTIVTDLPVRVDDYKELMENPPERIKNRFIFSSVPDRGLQNLWRMWPKLKQEVPDATLVITSDYRLWGAGNGAGNDQHRMRWIVRDGVQFLGAISRRQLLEEQMKSSFMLYPGNYPELFCIAVSEAQYAGVNCITSGCGALETTNMGTVVHVDAGNPHNDKLFVEATLKNVFSDNNPEQRKLFHHCVANRFSPDRIIDHWEQNILKEA